MGEDVSGRAKPPLLSKLLGGAAGATEDARSRILSAAIEQISDFGVRGFTVDELARRVGLSRVTIYRHFPSKQDVLEAALLRELRAFLDDAAELVAQYETVEERAVEGFVYSISRIRGHTVFQRVLRTEPELMLPLLTTHGAAVIEAGREFIFGLGQQDAAAGNLWIGEEQLLVLSEMLARMIVSLVLTPQTAVPLETEAQLRSFAQEYVAGIVRGFASTPAH